MPSIAKYLQAADRDRTRYSYASAIRHFEEEWRGLLPSTADSIARYLSDQAAIASLNTLKLRLAALSRWHQDQGFPDPTKQPLVRQVLKGIRALHPAIEKRAKPLHIEVLQQVDDWLQRGIVLATQQQDTARLWRLTRDRAVLLVGFWRGFRADELTHLRVEHVELQANIGMSCYVPRSKTDRQLNGRHFQCPALSRLCPVSAMAAWLTLSGLQSGPVFRKIDRWGCLRDIALQPTSLIHVLRRLFAAAGIDLPEEYSSHSLRRGFANWARDQGWDVKELMEYVGWRDMKSALRYLEATPAHWRNRFEQGLPPLTIPPTVRADGLLSASAATTPARTIHLTLNLLSSTRHRSTTRLQQRIRRRCLERYAALPLDSQSQRYELRIPMTEEDAVDIPLRELLDELHRFASDQQCSLEARCHDPLTNQWWE